MHNKLLIAIIFILLVPLAYYYYVTSNEAIDFSLDNWDTKGVTMNKLRGKVVILTFSYSFCSVRCPIITARLSSLDESMSAPEGVVYLHVSVDPDMDTPERRREYFNLYRINIENDNRWMFVSGQKDELSKLWSFYEIDIERVESDWLPEGYYMEYTPKLVIIDKNGSIRHVADFFFEDDEVANKIKAIT